MRRILIATCVLLAAACKREVALVDLPALTGKVEDIVLAGESKRSITAPLSAELSIPLELPPNAELVFSPALLSERRVPRARVDFRVALSVDGRAIEVYRREVGFDEGNSWHEARVDLGAWGGKSVAMTLSTEPSSGPSPVPWASRVRSAWGGPSIRARRTAPLGPNERPSFIVFLVDTLRADYLGAYGFEGAISPNLDRLAAESLLFENCFSNAPWTKPSIATLFSSLPPAVHGVTGMGKATRLTQVLPEEAETMAERFRGAGYRTAAFVSNPLISQEYGFSQGFDVFEWKQKWKSTSGLLAGARHWLSERASDRQSPFFLYLHLMDVHGPYDAPRADFEAVRQQMDRGVSRELTEEEYLRIPEYLRNTRWATKEERYELTSWRAKYGAGVHAFDRSVGPFLDELRASGVLDRAYVVFTSDHGEELFEHEGWHHGDNLYDQQLHVPLLVRKPLAEDAGRRISSLVSLVDLMPTLSSLGGVAMPSGILGRDVSALLRDGSEGRATAVVAGAVNEHPRVQGVRTLSHKLIWDEERGTLELYDLVADPKESRNLSEADPQSMARMKTYLREQLERNRARGALAPKSIPLDDELRDRLKALGYVH